MLLAQFTLQIGGSCVQILERIGFAALQISAPEPCAPRVQAVLQPLGFFVRGPRESDVPKFGLALQVDVEKDIHHTMRSVTLQLRLNRRLEISDAMEEIEEAGFRLFHPAAGV